MSQFVAVLLQITNEILTAAIVVIAASLLLYNLTRNLRNRIARTSGVVLACVTLAYIGDVFTSLGPEPDIYAAVLRLQWLGLAFIPAAMFHMSDALLATTGLPSRGRRRRVVWILYVFSLVFLLAATLTDILIVTVQSGRSISIQGGPFFILYGIFFVMINTAAFINVQRARQRCLTRRSERRMRYLQIAILTPAVGIFPFSVLLPPGNEFSLGVLLLVNAANLLVILMLVFISYPLSFFGSDKPDRVVKSELLRFFLRGPATGLLVLVTIIFTTQATRILGLRGEAFMPFAVVAVVLLWQWSIALALPYMEKFLIYHAEDDEQIAKLQELSDRSLTRGDLLQLIEATLEAVCDYLRVNTAFVILIHNNQLETTHCIGPLNFTLDDETAASLKSELSAVLPETRTNGQSSPFSTWRSYHIAPLYSARSLPDDHHSKALIGVIGVHHNSESLEQAHQEFESVQTFIHRIEQTLDDILLQEEIFAALEGLLPQITMTRSRAEEVEYRPGRQKVSPSGIYRRKDLYEQVRAALRHYWGGPGITHSRLLDLSIVRDEVVTTDSNPVHALRNVLRVAIEKQRPEGDRTMSSPAWTIYNILELRFVEGKKVSDVAQRLAISDSDLYRKQKIAIEAVTDTLIDMETNGPN